MFTEEFCQILRQGGVGVIPTDTVYGLVASIKNRDAVERVYEIKGRDFSKRCIILAANSSQLSGFGINKHLLPKMENEWTAARPTSLEVAIAEKVPAFLSRGFNKMSFRIPTLFPELIAFLECSGPLVGPSANPQGSEPALTAMAAKEYFGDRVDFYVDSGTSNAQPSRVVAFDEQGTGNVIRE